MINEELIKKLQQYPKDSEVVYSFINPIGDDVEVEADPFFNKGSNKIYL